MIPDLPRLAAFHRARETARRDAAFRDPLAASLAGDADPALARSLAYGDRVDWYYAARTVAMDRLLLREIAAGVDLVLQLGAGFDARPYRLALPASLRWVEVDAPEVLDYKAEIIGSAPASCLVERVDVDLANPDARRGLFNDLGRRASRVLVFAEGFLHHLMSSDVYELSFDLAIPPTFQRLLTDLSSRGLLDLLDETSGEIVRRAGAPYLFAPPDGPAFFRDSWQVLAARPLLATAAKLERLPVLLRLSAMLPETSARGDRPWAVACLLGRD